MSISKALVFCGSIFGIFVYAFSNASKKVFVSYYYDGDSHYKRLLTAWSANEKFRLSFKDISTDVSINSHDESYIKKVISKKIKDCDVLLVIIGKKTHKSSWVAWEISKAVEYSKKIVVVKESKNNAVPKELMLVGAKWVYGFKEESVRNAILECG